MRVTFFDVPGMVRVAVLASLGNHEDVADDTHVELVGCHDPDGWARVENGPSGRTGAVALVDELLPYMVYRALVLGEGVASSRWEPELVVTVLRQRALGMLSVPDGPTRLAMQRLPVPLTGSEVGVLPHLAAGLSPAEVSARTHFSERHVRRLRRSIIAKAGTDDIGTLWAAAG